MKNLSRNNHSMNHFTLPLLPTLPGRRALIAEYYCKQVFRGCTLRSNANIGERFYRVREGVYGSVKDIRRIVQ